MKCPECGEESSNLIRTCRCVKACVRCPDCEGSGHKIIIPSRQAMGSGIFVKKNDTIIVKHCPRCKGSGEVLQWYIDLNAGGIAHSEEEIARVRIILRLEREKIEY